MQVLVVYTLRRGLLGFENLQVNFALEFVARPSENMLTDGLPCLSVSFS